MLTKYRCKKCNTRLDLKVKRKGKKKKRIYHCNECNLNYREEEL